MAYTQNNPLGPAKKVGSRKDDDKKGGSNAGKYDASEGPFCGPSGGAPKGTYPVGSLKRAKSAIKLAHNAPRPSGIKSCVYKHFPQLKKGAARSKEKLEQVKSDMQTGKTHQTMGVKKYNKKIQRLNTKIARK